MAERRNEAWRAASTLLATRARKPVFLRRYRRSASIRFCCMQSANTAEPSPESREAVARSQRKHPAFWVPTLYFAEGLPMITVSVVAALMYKNLGVSNTDIALYTGSLYLPWSFKFA